MGIVAVEGVEDRLMQLVEGACFRRLDDPVKL